jgi:hypothetical protein
MTTEVHFFTHDGIVTAPVVGGNNYTTDSLLYLRQPYKGADKLSCESGTPDTSEASAAPAGGNIAYIQVQPGKTVHYEVTPTNYELRVANSNSPYMAGNMTMPWGEGWRLSVLEKT